jgi:hypothetical protein
VWFIVDAHKLYTHSYLLLDDYKPGSDDRTLRTATATSRRRWCRPGWRRWSRTALGLEEVCVVRLWINCDRLRTSERVYRGNRRVIIRGILVDDCDVALAPVRNVNQFFRRIPSQGVNARAVLDGRYDLARVWINDDGRIVAT